MSNMLGLAKVGYLTRLLNFFGVLTSDSDAPVSGTSPVPPELLEGGSDSESDDNVINESLEKENAAEEASSTSGEEEQLSEASTSKESDSKFCELETKEKEDVQILPWDSNLVKDHSARKEQLRLSKIRNKPKPSSTVPISPERRQCTSPSKLSNLEYSSTRKTSFGPAYGIIPEKASTSLEKMEGDSDETEGKTKKYPFSDCSSTSGPIMNETDNIEGESGDSGDSDDSDDSDVSDVSVADSDSEGSSIHEELRFEDSSIIAKVYSDALCRNLDNPITDEEYQLLRAAMRVCDAKLQRLIIALIRRLNVALPSTFRYKFSRLLRRFQHIEVLKAALCSPDDRSLRTFKNYGGCLAYKIEAKIFKKIVEVRSKKYSGTLPVHHLAYEYVFEMAYKILREAYGELEDKYMPI